MSNKIYVTHVYEITDKDLYGARNPFAEESGGLKCVAMSIGDLAGMAEDYEAAAPNAYQQSDMIHCRSSLDAYHGRAAAAAKIGGGHEV